MNFPKFLAWLLLAATGLFCGATLQAAAPKYLGACTQESLFLSDDAGQTWQKLAILASLNKSVYLTAAARCQTQPALVAVGTSFEGMYESPDGGKSWKKLDALKTFKPYHQGSGFYDEVVALAYADDGSADLFFKLGFNGEAFRYVRAKKTAQPIDPAAPEYAFLPSAFRYVYKTDDQTPNDADSLPPPDPAIPTPPEVLAAASAAASAPDPERAKRRSLAADKRGLYLNPNQARGSNLIRQLDFAVANKLNAVVVDFKDDQGYLSYDSQVPETALVKSVQKRIDAPTLVAEAHKRGIYVIARIVVFKDKQLAAYQKGAYSVWDKGDRPWGVFRQEQGESGPVWRQTEYWVDPYAEFVRQYNIDIAREAQSLGVDEIQFDYIRFPSDGNTATLYCRFHKDAEGKTVRDESNGGQRVRALCAFLRQAREALTIPIGTDVFGFNGWARMSYLGQDIQAFSRYVDVISPMMYPSHYAREFLGGLKYFDRASYIYEAGTRRARTITNNRALIRPYVQAFLLGGETKWEEPQYFDYLNRQVKSAYLGGASGFTLWNNLGRYYMVDAKNFSGLFPDRSARQP